MTNFDFTKIESEIIQNPWRNVYWFARMLINGDKYGAVGKDSKNLAGLAAQLRLILDEKGQNIDEKLAVCKGVIREVLQTRYAKASALISRVNLFCDDLEKRLESLADVAVFILTAESIMIPINNALDGIPNNDREFTIATATAYLDKQ